MPVPVPRSELVRYDMASHRLKKHAPSTTTRWKGLSFDAAAVSVLATVVVIAFVYAAIEYEVPEDTTTVEILVNTSPRVWLQHGFLTSDECDELISSSTHLPASCMEVVSDTQLTVMLDDCPAFSTTLLMQDIDKRVAAKLGVPLAQLEPGYIQIYRPGYSAHNVHLDQGHAMYPARIASAIIYLDDQPSGSGHTIFPLSDLPDWKRAHDAHEARSHRQPLTLKAAREQWEIPLRSGRILSRFFTPSGYGASLFGLAAKQCALGMGVRPERGTALFFEARDADGHETIAAVHGSCGIGDNSPTKHALVKLATDAPLRAG